VLCSANLFTQRTGIGRLLFFCFLRRKQNKKSEGIQTLQNWKAVTAVDGKSRSLLQYKRPLLKEQPVCAFIIPVDPSGKFQKLLNL